jgi:flagellin
MSGIVLSGAVRSNLITLQSTAESQARVQERLSTGKKVNSALDNPTNFFTASGLSRRATNLSALLDGMSQGIKTLEAADNAMKSITKTVETMQANIRQARQDKSFKGTSYTIDTAAVTAVGIDTNAEAEQVSFTGGAVGTTPVPVDLSTARGVLTAGTNYANLDFAEAGDTINFKVALNGSATTTQVTIENGTAANSLKITVGGVVTDSIAVVSEAAVTGAEMASALTTAFTAADVGIAVTGSTGAKLVFTATSTAADDGSTAEVEMSNLVIANGGGGAALAAADFGFVAGGLGVSAGGVQTIGNVTAKTIDTLVSEINADTSLANKVRASNDGGKLRIENFSTEALTVTGVSSTDGEIDGTAGTSTIGGNDVRKGLIAQFNDLRKQLDKLASDGSYNGINLVKADKLKITFNEYGTSSIEIQAKDVAGNVRGISTESTSLNIAEATATEFSTDTDLDARLEELNDSLTVLQTQSSSFGAALTTVQNRQEFTKAMINTLQQGADSLTLADSNEEGANLLALNTRQQLSQTALSLASQASQAVLRLF